MIIVNRRSVFLIVIFLGIIAAGLYALLQSMHKPAPDVILKAEQEIYLAMLTDLSFKEGNKYPILEHTTLGILQEIETFQFNKEINSETILDFQENNKREYPIKNYLPSKINIASNIIENQEPYWWVSFSRVGFNPSITQALISYEDHLECIQGSCSYGIGYLIFFEKIEGEWTIQDRFMYWRSHPT